MGQPEGAFLGRTPNGRVRCLYGWARQGHGRHREPPAPRFSAAPQRSYVSQHSENSYSDCYSKGDLALWQRTGLINLVIEGFADEIGGTVGTDPRTSEADSIAAPQAPQNAGRLGSDGRSGSECLRLPLSIAHPALQMD